ncbi:GNAT family N-acetyltransferase [Rhodovulum kholense]|uniref:RimJ/RimL family protein N-acetyltransferase n=1 Tax=Rhodovulum kholense TaxID=453584 RepID=A0A8E3AR42_9RHOB|nr:GNAT family N-acetyltransferase [Rhodovulum kholense]PTW49912.1 RimJ/RimL family protein N-acetyltransferase [Rhodovulum kholense]
MTGAADGFRVETPRLILREFRPEDVTPLLRIGRDRRVSQMMSTLPVRWTQSQAADWIARSRFRGEPGFRLAIERRGSGLVGVAGLGGAPAMLAYFLDPAVWGQGYATEAAKAFVAAAFARFRGLDVLAADHFADNPGSGRVLEKLGFERLGRGAGRSLARLEPAPNIHYRLIRAKFEARHEIP